MLNDWRRALEFFGNLMLVALFVLGVLVGCGGLWLVQWLLGHISISVR